MYLRVHLISTRDTKCVIYARKIQVISCTYVHIFYIPVNFLPFAVVDPGPADSSAEFGGGAGVAAQPGGRMIDAGDEAAVVVSFPEVGDFDVQYVHGYGKVANVEAGACFWRIVLGSSIGRSSGAFRCGPWVPGPVVGSEGTWQRRQ